MNPINLIPDDIVGTQTATHGSWKRWIPVLAVTAIIFTWALVIVLHDRHLDARMTDVAGSVEEAYASGHVSSDPKSPVGRAQAVYATSGHLREPLPPQSLIALLSQQMPAEVSLNDLVIDIPALSIAKATNTAETPAIAIYLSGEAPNDTAIPELINRLSAIGVFREIVLKENDRAVESGVVSWKFALVMQIELIADSQENTREVARAN